ncbi:MAG TPA: alpha/beta hydrolase [Candidatus Thermoplasmatota archaeon]|nr:alpha/beta hydrolase [Candidatus Thermoplasmatota archaeon]
MNLIPATLQPPAARNPPGGAAGARLPAKGTVTSKDGTRIAYETAGSGPPLILVMGALGSKDQSFAKDYTREFAKHFTVVNYDRRGRGESTDTKPYAVAREVEDIEALARATGGAPNVFGLSSGAALAIEAAASGVPMRRLVAYEPPYMVEGAMDPPDADFREKLQKFADEDRRSEAVAYFMRTVGVPGFAVAIMKLFPFWKDLKANAHTLPYDAAVMDRFRVPTDRLARVKVPTLVAGGSKSPANLKQAVEAAANGIPNARRQTLPKQNHGVKAKAIAPVVAAFCA